MGCWCELESVGEMIWMLVIVYGQRNHEAPSKPRDTQVALMGGYGSGQYPELAG